MANQDHERGNAPQAQWMSMGQPQQARDDAVYKPTSLSQTLEVIDSESTPPHRKQSFVQEHFGGLKRTLRAFAVVGVLVLGVNVGWLAYAKSEYDIVDGYGTIKTGNCASVKRLNTWFHLAINILSTLLLTGSNAFMAAYSAPTRQEIDQAHARKRWLHVGCVSLRNIFGISWTKSLIVIVFALSSAPFHLLYNSLVYTQLSANNYYWAITTEDFVTGAAFNLTGPLRYSPLYPAGRFSITASFPDDQYFTPYRGGLSNNDRVENFIQYVENIQNSVADWERLDQKACIQAYSSAFISDRRNVVLISSDRNSTNSVLEYGSAELFTGSDVVNNWWICSLSTNDGGNMQCNPQDYVANANSWEVYGYPIEYCFSQQVQDECSVKFSLQIMLVVVAFNALKVVAMIWILFRLDAEHLLTCVGDAATSFIKTPDHSTVGMCLVDRKHIDTHWQMPGPRVYNGGGSRRWDTAVSKRRWILFTLLMLVAWGIVLGFAIWGFINTKSKGVSLTPSGLASLGFGALHQNALAWPGGAYFNTIVLSIIANIPQVFLAVIYLMYTGVMTAMFDAADWARFAQTPQTLMVSSPTGTQRGTWLLGAPIGWGLGLLALQTLLHWFVSQSIFVVQIIVLDKLGRVETDLDVNLNLGYSPIAIICSITASGVLYLTAIVFMLRKHPTTAAPIVSTCSAAISAACHLPENLMSEAVTWEKLGWGVTAEGSDGVGHCSLGPVKGNETLEAPVLGKSYAGVRNRGFGKGVNNDI